MVALEEPDRFGGIVDRRIGVLAGLPAVGAGIVLAVGAIMLFTGAIGFCPLTALLGINTCAPKPGTKK